MCPCDCPRASRHASHLTLDSRVRFITMVVVVIFLSFLCLLVCPSCVQARRALQGKDRAPRHRPLAHCQVCPSLEEVPVRSSLRRVRAVTGQPLAERDALRPRRLCGSKCTHVGRRHSELAACWPPPGGSELSAVSHAFSFFPTFIFLSTLICDI